jgi:hypothetical protein
MERIYDDRNVAFSSSSCRMMFMLYMRAWLFLVKLFFFIQCSSTSHHIRYTNCKLFWAGKIFLSHYFNIYILSSTAKQHKKSKIIVKKNKNRDVIERCETCKTRHKVFTACSVLVRSFLSSFRFIFSFYFSFNRLMLLCLHGKGAERRMMMGSFTIKVYLVAI